MRFALPGPIACMFIGAAGCGGQADEVAPLSSHDVARVLCEQAFACGCQSQYYSSAEECTERLGDMGEGGYQRWEESGLTVDRDCLERQFAHQIASITERGCSRDGAPYPHEQCLYGSMGLGEPCGVGLDCELGLSCDWDTAVCIDPNAPVPPKSLGERCLSGQCEDQLECWEGHCMAMSPPREVGEACGDCEEFTSCWCTSGAFCDDRVCAARRTLEEQCSSYLSCKASLHCDVNTGRCAERRENGEACDGQPYQCEGFCDSVEVPSSGSAGVCSGGGPPVCGEMDSIRPPD